jgi:hypothetical protein
MSLSILTHAFGFDSVRSKWNAPIFILHHRENNAARLLLHYSPLHFGTAGVHWPEAEHSISAAPTSLWFALHSNLILSSNTRPREADPTTNPFTGGLTAGHHIPAAGVNARIINHSLGSFSAETRWEALYASFLEVIRRTRMGHRCIDHSLGSFSIRWNEMRDCQMIPF